MKRTREEYFYDKCDRIAEEHEEFRLQQISTIFKNVRIYINGFTVPGNAELKRLICLHGGSFSYYLDRSKVSHVIASKISKSRVLEELSYKKVIPYVYPTWITDSISKNELIPYENYILSEMKIENQKSLFPESESSSSSLLCPSKKANLSIGFTTAKDDPNFLNKYFRGSRLHFLGTFKSHLKRKLKEDNKFNNNNKEREKLLLLDEDKHTIYCHIDMDCYFVSVSLLKHPEYRDKPVVVSTAPNLKHSDVSCANYVARKLGISRNMWLENAKKMCNDLIVLPYDFDLILKTSEKIFEIFYSYTDKVEPLSCDEAILDISDFDNPLSIASEIRDKIFKETGCQASAGIGENLLLAKVALKKAKPNGQYEMSIMDFNKFIGNQSVSILPGVGYHTLSLLEQNNIKRCNDLLNIPQPRLWQWLGRKSGETLWQHVRGIDNRKLNSNTKPQSIGAQVSWGIRFNTLNEVNTFLEKLSNEVCERLKENNLLGKCITINLKQKSENAPEATKYLGHGQCDNHSKSTTLGVTTDDIKIIFPAVKNLFLQFKCKPNDVRGLGINITKLSDDSITEASVESFFKNNGNCENNNNSNNNDENNIKRERVIGEDGFITPSQVDMNVLDELPPEIRKEYKSAITLHRKTKEWSEHNMKRRKIEEELKEEEKKKDDENDDKLLDEVEVPSYSQLDINAIESFNSKIQHKIIEKSINIHKNNKIKINKPEWYKEYQMNSNNFSIVRKKYKEWLFTNENNKIMISNVLYDIINDILAFNLELIGEIMKILKNIYGDLFKELEDRIQDRILSIYNCKLSFNY